MDAKKSSKRVLEVKPSKITRTDRRVSLNYGYNNGNGSALSAVAMRIYNESTSAIETQNYSMEEDVKEPRSFKTRGAGKYAPLTKNRSLGRLEQMTNSITREGVALEQVRESTKQRIGGGIGIRLNESSTTNLAEESMAPSRGVSEVLPGPSS